MSVSATSDGHTGARSRMGGMVSLRLTEAEIGLVRQAAAEKEQSVSAFVREAALVAAGAVPASSVAFTLGTQGTPSTRSTTGVVQVPDVSGINIVLTSSLAADDTSADS